VLGLRAAAAVLAVVYAAWGVAGFRAGRAAHRGIELAAVSSTDDALRELDRGSVGYDASECTWLAGEVALGLADGATDPGAGLAALNVATARYLRMMNITSGSAYGLIGLAAVEDRLEHAEASVRPTDLSALSAGPWALVGAHARMAIGLLYLAIEREPTLCAAHDALLTTLLRHGLVEEAKAAAREAALAAPALEYHPELDARILPPDVVRAFDEGAHEALDTAPLVSRERKLFYLGLLDERVGNLVDAVENLRRAHAEPAGSIERAESAYHLGRVLARAGHVDEAESAWADAERSPVFRTAVATERAKIAESSHHPDVALARLADARRWEPRRLDLILWEARLLRAAGNNVAAIDTLKWGVSIDDSNRAVRAALVGALIDDGDDTGARRALEDFQSTLGAGEDTRALESRLAHDR
jgi:tetratricopeptide (TPR) repeat protein